MLQDPWGVQMGCQGITDNFEVIGDALGQGSTGVVYRARRRSDDKKVALKVMRMRDEEMLAIAKEEFTILRALKHPNIIQAYDFFTYSLGAVLVLELFHEGLTLEMAVHEAPARRLDECMSRKLFLCMMEAIEYLHGHGIIHRDIKAPNVLVNADLGELKIVDFNTARRVAQGALTMTGTADYLPPEVLLGESLCESSDIWAAGVCLFFMLQGSLPLERRLFSSHHAFGTAHNSTRAEKRFMGEKWAHLPGSCVDTLRRCLEVDHSLRPTAQDVLALDWLAAARL
jgi:serine/threonine protein kinase